MKKSALNRDNDKIISELIEFLDISKSPWHAVAFVKQRLAAQGFVELHEEEKWKLQPGKGYFVSRNGSSLAAFILPKQQPEKATIVAAHTDSPALKLKPNTEYRKENMILFGVEVYGSPLLSSWLNRDLGIAGRVTYQDKKGNIGESLVSLKEHPIVIPQLAVHLDRGVNDDGLVLNKQEHLPAIAALDTHLDPKASYLESLLKSQVNYEHLLGHDLFLMPLEPARLMGDRQQLIASHAIDNLGSVHAAITGLLAAKASTHVLKMCVFWDNEEIGSNTKQGAASPFLAHTLERITLATGLGREEYLRMIPQSSCLSIDMAHALHPNYQNKFEPHHQTLLGKGPVLKINAQQRYATDAVSAAAIAHLCKKGKIPLQTFVTRSNMPCGSTIGPIHATLMGMPTVDLGNPQLSMHSIRELASCQDHLDMCRLLTAALQ